MDEQILKDFIATAQANNYNWRVTIDKFPELQNYDWQLLKDYVATAEAKNYNYAEVNAKFPEFNFTTQEVKDEFNKDPLREALKKKDVSESVCYRKN